MTTSRCDRRQRPVYWVDFHDLEGGVSWWDCFFSDIAEAERWAEWELVRLAHGQPGWFAKIHRCHWEGYELKLDEKDVHDVGPSTGMWPPQTLRDLDSDA